MRGRGIGSYGHQEPELFAEEGTRLRVALGDLAVAIEHYGSTSVPGGGEPPGSPRGARSHALCLQLSGTLRFGRTLHGSRTGDLGRCVSCYLSTLIPSRGRA